MDVDVCIYVKDKESWTKAVRFSHFYNLKMATNLSLYVVLKV